VEINADPDSLVQGDRYRPFGHTLFTDDAQDLVGVARISTERAESAGESAPSRRGGGIGGTSAIDVIGAIGSED
jgi:hypothetical protein